MTHRTNPLTLIRGVNIINLVALMVFLPRVLLLCGGSVMLLFGITLLTTMYHVMCKL